MKAINVKGLLTDLKEVFEKHGLKEISNIDNAYLGFNKDGVFSMRGYKIVSLESHHKTMPVSTGYELEFKRNHHERELKN